MTGYSHVLKRFELLCFLVDQHVLYVPRVVFTNIFSDSFEDLTPESRGDTLVIPVKGAGRKVEHGWTIEQLVMVAHVAFNGFFFFELGFHPLFICLLSSPVLLSFAS